MKALTLATFSDTKDAKIIQQRLEQAGIKSNILDESAKQRIAMMSEDLASVRVEVDENDFETANRLIHEWDAQDNILRDEVRCPNCRSAAIEYPQMTRKFVTPWIHTLLFKIHAVEKKFYCQECHYMWPMAEKVEEKTDVLGWPIKQEGSHTSDTARH